MANYRYVYEYNGRRYVIEAPAGATESDLQSIISAAPPPKAAPPKAQPKPKKKEEEPFYSGFLPTLKKATGELGQDVVSLLSRIPSSADIFDPILGDRDTRPRPVADALRKAAVGLTERGKAELPEASRREAEAQRKFVAEAKPGLGSQILSGIGRAGAALPSFTPFDIGGLSRRFLPQTPEEAATTIAAVEAPFQTARGATEFVASQLPATAIPLGGGKAVQLGARPLARALGKDIGEEALRRSVGTGVVATGSALNAASAGRQAYENVLAAGGSEDEANRAYNIAASGAAVVSGVAARMPGLEQQVFAATPKPGGFIRQGIRAAAGEAPQEFVEEGGAQLAQNIGQLGTAAEVPIEKDVLTSGALGAIGGGMIAAPIGAFQGLANRGAPEQELPPEAAAPRTAPRPSPPPADMGALAAALGPVGGKITLQEPSGPQEYTYQGRDEDGSVLLADADGQLFAEDPDQIAAAMQVGAAESEEGMGGMAFGVDITEGLEEPAPAAPVPATEPAIEVSPEPAAEPTPAPTGAELPIDENVLPYLKQQERSNTPTFMAALEKEARQIAADEGAASVSSSHFSQALNNQATRTAGTEVPFAGDWQQVTRPAPAPERVRTVTTPGGSKVNTAFEVVDAKDLTAASGDLQNRDRSRAATDLQVQDIFSNFDPERLGESLESDRGSPIIGPDNVVESGNGRVMAINKVYDESPERADAYRKFIEAQGFDTSGIDRPVLVRRRIDDLTPGARAQFVRESNMDTKLQLSTSERAQTDAASLTPDVMSLMVSPDVSSAANQDFVRAFLSKLPAQEQAAFLDKDGRLSAEGLRRLRTAVKASAYGDADLINTLDESQDNNIKSIGGALEDVAPAWRRFRDAVADGTVRPEMDVTENLVEAAKIVRDVRNQGTKINDFLAQQDAFNPLDPVTERFIRSFYNQKSGRASGREAIADVLERYARRASEQTTAEGLFEREAMSPADILDGIMEGAEQGGLFNNGKGVENNAQVMEVLNAGTPDQMKNAIAQAQKPDDKIIKEGANLQKKNRGCD